jgi:hypothetical protein
MIERLVRTLGKLVGRIDVHELDEPLTKARRDRAEIAHALGAGGEPASDVDRQPHPTRAGRPQ